MSIKKILIAALLLPGFSLAQTITTTVGFGPGSGNEVSFRAVAQIVERQNLNIKFV